MKSPLYTLRPPQQTAVDQTVAFWAKKNDPARRKFLWNAKPRFGKTLAAYNFAERIVAKRILIVTNRPAIADSWAQDFFRYLAPSSDFIFASSRPERGANRIYSRAELLKNQSLLSRPLIYFISLQDIKGKDPTSNDFKIKNRWIFEVEQPWDLLIIDEGHDGAGTAKSRSVFSRIKSDFTLVLSGTPFRILASQEFADEQIYNWTYLDEQSSSTLLPPLEFCLSEPLSNIDAQLDFLAQELSDPHSLWLLSDVEACRAMRARLQQHPSFRDYQIILAAGRDAATHGLQTLTAVREAIGSHPERTRTITLSCGQLTTGITVPDWSAVVMLYDSNDLTRMSSTQYLQAAFRAQNHSPAHIFDFCPARCLTVLQDYAQNLCGHEQLSELFAYLKVVYFEQGKWRTLTHTEISSLPQQIIAREIVDSGFTHVNQILQITPNVEFSARTKRILHKIGQIAPVTHHSARIQTPVETIPRSHKAKRDVADYYVNQLHKLTRSIPFLLHLYAPKYSSGDIKFSDLLEQIPTQDFSRITGINKSELSHLISEGLFNEANLNLAITEFLTRAKNLSEQIFQYIPTPQGGEVFTPITVTDDVLDLLEQANPKIFRSPDLIFFDPAASSGIFLARIARRLYHNLRPHFTNDHDCFLHILSQQIFASSSSSIYRRSVLNTLVSLANFSSIEIELIAKNLQIINFQKGIKMSKAFRPDIIISNPPYQQGHRQVYADFYKLAVDLDPEILCMIFPLGWQKPNNHNGLGQINRPMYKRDPHLVSIDNYVGRAAEKLFPGFGTGGVNIVLRDKKHHNHGVIKQYEAGKFIGEISLPQILPLSAQEVTKPTELTCLIDLLADFPKISALGSARKPYGFYADPLRHPEKYHLYLQDEAQHTNDVRLFGLFDDITRGYKFIPRKDLPKISPNIDAWKLFVPKAWGNMSERIGLGGSYANICVARPGDVCSETFIEFGPFKNQNEAYRMAKYFLTKFFRALLYLAKTSQNTAKDKYRYIPVPDLSDKIFDQTISKLDQALFDKYQIPSRSRDFILQNIQSRDENNIELL